MSTKRKRHFIVAKILDKRGRLLSMATNSYIKTDPLFSETAKRVNRPHKEYVHAEASSIFKLKWNDRKRAHTMYVYRFHEDGTPANACPCEVCRELIKLTNIKEVYYTNEDSALDMDFPKYAEMRANAKNWVRNE